MRSLVRGLVVSVFCGMVVVGLHGAAGRINRHGVSLVPPRPHPPQRPPHFVQFDRRWGRDRMQPSRTTLARSGCLVTIVASSLAHMGFDVDPGRLNQTLARERGYTRSGNIIWQALRRAFPPVRYAYRHFFSGRTASRDLAHGRLPLVQVRRGIARRPHWLMIVGADAREFLVLDPARTSSRPVGLGSYGRVHAYRVLRR